MTPEDPNWHSDVIAPLTLDKPDAHDWHADADVVVIGLGGAGVAAALQAIELGLSVTAIDAYEGGGATAASGGVIYAGGGTATQEAAGVDDDPENMFNYLKLESQGIVKDETLKAFCDESAETIDWLTGHGCDFRPTYWPKKTSYPAPEYFLYHSDNTLIENYKKHARPAARGHRGYVPIEQGRKATGLGGSIFNPMREAAAQRGMALFDFTQANQLILDSKGAVIGVNALRFPDAESKAKYVELRGKAIAIMAKWLPIMPGSGHFLKKAKAMLAEAKALTNTREVVSIRARKGVVLSAGGFVFNSKMVDHYAPKYKSGYPLGTDGDNGSGIRLGQSAGGRLGNMDRVTAWRFINPPISFTKGMVVSGKGERVMDERVYGATMGVELAENHGGEGWLILDKALVKAALNDVSGKKALQFQRDLARLNVWFAAKKAKTLDGLAEKIGMDADTLKASAAAYNAAARGEKDDPKGKPANDMAELGNGKYYAINIGLNAKMFPCPTLTLGGLMVNEKTGQVKKETGNGHIKGLYAAGRNAVGVASWNYISGLSIADGVFSGRRAARHMAGVK